MEFINDMYRYFDNTTLGFVAAILTTASLLPQTLQTIRTKKTRDISLYTYLALVAGMGMWVIYGVMLQQAPIIAANIVSLLFALPILYLKLRQKK